MPPPTEEEEETEEDNFSLDVVVVPESVATVVLAAAATLAVASITTLSPVVCGVGRFSTQDNDGDVVVVVDLGCRPVTGFAVDVHVGAAVEDDATAEVETPKVVVEAVTSPTSATLVSEELWKRVFDDVDDDVDDDDVVDDDVEAGGSESPASSPAPAPSKSAFTFLNPLTGFVEILLIVIRRWGAARRGK